MPEIPTPTNFQEKKFQTLHPAVKHSLYKACNTKVWDRASQSTTKTGSPKIRKLICPVEQKIFSELGYYKALQLTSADALLLSGENARTVDDTDALQNLIWKLRTHEPAGKEGKKNH